MPSLVYIPITKGELERTRRRRSEEKERTSEKADTSGKTTGRDGRLAVCLRQRTVSVGDPLQLTFNMEMAAS